MHSNIRPTTLAGIKRLARQFNAAEGIQHATALDKASEAAGYSNFRAARHALADSSATTSIASFSLYLTQYWKDRLTDEEGRETLELRLAQPWHELIDPRKLETHRATSGFTVVAPDHLEKRGQHHSQSLARRAICAAARLFQFMQATGLRPATGVRGYQRVFNDRALIRAIPGADHESLWFDAKLARYVFAIEPYGNPDFIDQLTAWADPHGIDVAASQWGLYAPDLQAEMFLFSQKDHGVPLQPIVKALGRLAKPLVEADWGGESAPMLPFFTSPRHGEPSLLNARRRARTGPVKVRGKRQMHWARKLLVLGVNELLQRGLISKDAASEEHGHCETVIAGRPSVIQWHDIGHEELRISVWWDYDHSRHPQANLNGSYREKFNTSEPLAKRSTYRRFVGAIASGWLERKMRFALQGRRSIGLFDFYLRTDARAALLDIPTPSALGFCTEGPVY